MYLDSFNSTFYPYSNIYIHFKAFEWLPEYAQTSTKEKLYYITNKSIAPIIEFTKSNLAEKTNGRLYWSKYFSGNPEYNILEFGIIYDEVVKWVKKNAGGIIKEQGSNLYYFKDAWDKYQSQNRP